MSSRWKERNAKSKKDWRCEEDNTCQSEWDPLEWDRQLCLGQWQWRRRGWRKKFGWLGALQSLWLGDRKVGSQVIGDRSQIPGRRTVEEVWRGGRWGRRASDRAKTRVYRFRVGFGRVRRASRLPCLSLCLGDDRQSAWGSWDVSLAIFITSVSGSESTCQRKPCVFH